MALLSHELPQPAEQPVSVDRVVAYSPRIRQKDATSSSWLSAAKTAGLSLLAGLLATGAVVGISHFISKDNVQIQNMRTESGSTVVTGGIVDGDGFHSALPAGAGMDLETIVNSQPLYENRQTGQTDPWTGKPIEITVTKNAVGSSPQSP